MRNHNSTETKKIEVHQTLHGYEGGHRLIESSRPVPADSDRKMHILSDMSGSNLVRGFEDYFTGYALPEIGCYVLARTWYADEMDRPGCVWTHSLLIDQDNIRFINTYKLIHHFQRPQNKEGPFKEYSDALKIHHTSSSEQKPNWPESLSFMDDQKKLQEQRQLAQTVLGALYESPDNPVFLEARRASEYQWLPLRIWDQQWPSLRTEFSFCTGAIDGREIQGEPLDLQVVPSKRVRSLKSKFRSGEFIPCDSPYSLDTKDNCKWIDISVRNILSKGEHKLSEYFNRCDPKVKNGRSVFVPLINIYERIYKKRDIKKDGIIDVINILSKNFPSSKSAYNLKETVIKKSTKSSFSCEVIVGICSKEVGKVFENEILVDSILNSKCVSDYSEDKILLELVKAELNEGGKKVVKKLVELVDIEGVIRGVKENATLLQHVLVTRPEVVEESEFWKQELRRRFDRDIVVLAEESLEAGAKFSSLIGAMMEAGRTHAASDLVRSGGKGRLIDFLNWANEADEFQEKDLDWNLRGKVRSSPEYIEAWLAQCERPRADLIALIADLLSPNRLKVKNTGPTVWVQAARSVSESKLERRKYVRSLSFILVLGFDAEEGKPLIVSTFQSVHDAAASDDLDSKSRGWLRDVLTTYTRPSLGDVLGWDYCAKLRRALVTRWLDDDWPKTELLDAVTEVDTLRKTLSLISRTEEGDAWIEQLKQQLRIQEVDLDEMKLSVLKEE